MKKMTLLSVVTASLLITACGETPISGVGLPDQSVQIGAITKSFEEMHILADAKRNGGIPVESTHEIKSHTEHVEKSEAKTEKAQTSDATSTNVTVEHKITSIGEDKTIGEIVTASVAGSVVASAKEETKSSEVKITTRDARESREPRAEEKVEKEVAKVDETKKVVEVKKTDAFDYKLSPKKVAENVWCFFGAIEKPTPENAGNMANNCYIKTDDGYLVMDTGPSYQFAKQAYEAMQKIEDLPVKYVVNSHEHDDHWLGNDFYKQKFNTELIGPESINTNYKDGDKTRMYNVLPPNAIEGTKIIKLDKTPKEPYTLKVGGEEFRIIPMDTKAHTGDDIFIHMPKRKVLFAGDLVMNGRITSGRHGSVMGQLKALAMMKKLDWNIMIPGHGFITDGSAMDEAQMYFDLTKDRVLKAIDEGVDATEINEVVKLIEFKDKAMYDILNAHNIGFAFDELEMLEDADEDEEEAEEAPVEEKKTEAKTEEKIAPTKIEAKIEEKITPAKVETPQKEEKVEAKVESNISDVPAVLSTPEVTKVATVDSPEKVAVTQKLTSTDAPKSIGAIIQEATSREGRESRGTREDAEVESKEKATIKVKEEVKTEATAEVKANVKEEVKAETNVTKVDVFDYKLEPKKVSENVWCFFGALEPPTKENAGNMANNCYIKTNSGYVVMDTGPSYQFAKQAYEAMAKIEKLPVRYVIVSHEHDDHWLGNDFYKQEFGATLIGPESVNTEYKEGVPTRMFNVLPENAIKGTHIIKLNETPKEQYTLTFGGEKFDIIPMDTKAHTGDDIFVYMPERKVLFAGDLVMNGRITSGRHGTVMGQLKALAMMQKLDWKVMIPGHGFITDGSAIDEAQMYFDLTKDRVLKAIDDGVDATEINEVVKLIEFKDKAMYDILNAHNIGFAFDELEMLD